MEIEKPKKTTKHATSVYFNQKIEHSPDRVYEKLSEVLNSLKYWHGEATNLAGRVDRLEQELAFLRKNYCMPGWKYK